MSHESLTPLQNDYNKSREEALAKAQLRAEKLNSRPKEWLERVKHELEEAKAELAEYETQDPQKRLPIGTPMYVDDPYDPYAKVAKLERQVAEAEAREEELAKNPRNCLGALQENALREDHERTLALERLQGLDKVLKKASESTGLSPQEVLNFIWNTDVVKLQEKLNRFRYNIEREDIGSELAKINLKLPH